MSSHARRSRPWPRLFGISVGLATLALLAPATLGPVSSVRADDGVNSIVAKVVEAKGGVELSGR